MNDDIDLPPLPNGVIPGLADWINDVRRAAIRYDRERRAKVDAKPVVPVVHEAQVVGDCWREPGHERCAVARLKRLHDIVNKQALDDGLWFRAQHVTEDYLQVALRRLHAAIEVGEASDD